MADLSPTRYDVHVPSYSTTYASHIRDAEHFASIAAPLDGENVLDLCSGTGFVTLAMVSKMTRGVCVAMDISAPALDVLQAGYDRLVSQQAETLPSMKKVRDNVINATDLSKAKQQLPDTAKGFDLITCCLAIQILGEDVPEYLRRWSQLLAPGGRIVVDSPFFSLQHRDMRPWLIDAHLISKSTVLQLCTNPTTVFWRPDQLSSTEQVRLWMCDAAWRDGDIAVCADEGRRIANAAGLEVHHVATAHPVSETDGYIGELVDELVEHTWFSQHSSLPRSANGWNRFLSLDLQVKHQLHNEFTSGQRPVPGLRQFNPATKHFFCNFKNTAVILTMSKLDDQ